MEHALERWVQRRGGVVDGVTIASLGDGERGLVLARDVAAHTTLLSVPLASCGGSVRGAATPAGRAWLAACAASGATASPVALAAVWFCEERAKGASAFAPFLASLPSRDALGHLPLFWDNGALRTALRGSPCLGHVDAQRRRRCQASLSGRLLRATSAATRLAQPVSDAVARTTMFKRFTQEECVSSQSQVKSSVGRAIRTAICDQYPKIEDVIDELLPKKESLVLAKCTNHIQLLDHVWRTDAGAIRFVLGGSNVMCPGFTHDDGDMPADLPVDAPVVVGAFGKKHAMAIGQVKMTKGDILEKNKGICVDNLHFLNDGLWQLKNGQLD
ncbi:hypothetical protein JL722_13914 [Aureococcus anophagefferens]|nr:hypothetical protein JL722_13914 [Aureococcus anophagefferens]